MSKASGRFIIDIGNDTIMFKVPLFSETEDYQNIERWLRIDVSNLVGELVVNPLMLNRFGILLAEAEDKTRRAKMNYEVWTAKTIKAFRTKRSIKGEKNPTKPEVDEHILLHKDRTKKFNKYLEAQKSEGYINSIYWSFKEKQENLKKLSLTLQQGDLDSQTVQQALSHLESVEQIKVS